MKLREQIQCAVVNQLRSGEDKSEWIEKISNEFAIGFAKWCVTTQAFGFYPYEIALEIYKKENEL